MDTTQNTKYADEHRNPARRETITQRQWTRMHSDYKTGSPSKGTAKVMRLTDQGTVLVPVAVV